MRTIGFNVTGHPALALPIGVSEAGLPIGMQIVGRHFEEAVICQLGDAYERVGGLAGRVPPHAAVPPDAFAS
jgi:Asp-tRNA(Asn)/Glu-tRNA(Gln) amidotransferase A subunit family amidase